MIRTAKLALTAPLAGLAVLAGVTFGSLAAQDQPVSHQAVAAAADVTTAAATTTPPPPGPDDTHW